MKVGKEMSDSTAHLLQWDIRWTLKIIPHVLEVGEKRIEYKNFLLKSSPRPFLLDSTVFLSLEYLPPKISSNLPRIHLFPTLLSPTPLHT